MCLHLIGGIIRVLVLQLEDHIHTQVLSLSLSILSNHVQYSVEIIAKSPLTLLHQCVDLSTRMRKGLAGHVQRKIRIMETVVTTE